MADRAQADRRGPRRRRTRPRRQDLRPRQLGHLAPEPPTGPAADARPRASRAREHDAEGRPADGTGALHRGRGPADHLRPADRGGRARAAALSVTAAVSRVAVAGSHWNAQLWSCSNYRAGMKSVWGRAPCLPIPVLDSVAAHARALGRTVVDDDLFLLALTCLQGTELAPRALMAEGIDSEQLLGLIKVSGDAPLDPARPLTFAPAYYQLEGRAQAFAAAHARQYRPFTHPRANASNSG